MQNVKTTGYTSIPAVHTMKFEVMTRVLSVTQSCISAMAGIQKMKELGVSCDGPSSYRFCDYIKATIADYFEGVCKDLTEQHSGGTMAKCEVESDLLNPSGLRFIHSPRSGDEVEGMEEAANKYIELIDFQKIYESLTRQTLGLRSSGLADQATALAKHLDIGFYQGSRFSRISKKPRHIVFVTGRVSYYHRWDSRKDYDLTANALDSVSRETGFDFGPATSELGKAIDALTYEAQLIPSRTVFGKGKGLEIHCFNDKYEYRFTHEAFEAVQAFFEAHADEKCLEGIRQVHEKFYTAASSSAVC